MNTENRKPIMIDVDPRNQNLLRELYTQIIDAQNKMQLICTTIVNNSGYEGTFNLSKDFTKIIEDIQDIQGNVKEQEQTET